MKQVTETEFYAFVRPQNYSVTGGENKRATIYKLRHTDKVLGKVVESSKPKERHEGKGHTYFINQ